MVGDPGRQRGASPGLVEVVLGNGGGNENRETVIDMPRSRKKEPAGAASLPHVSIHLIQRVAAVEGGWKQPCSKKKELAEALYVYVRPM